MGQAYQIRIIHGYDEEVYFFLTYETAQEFFENYDNDLDTYFEEIDLIGFVEKDSFLEEGDEFDGGIVVKTSQLYYNNKHNLCVTDEGGCLIFVKNDSPRHIDCYTK